MRLVAGATRFNRHTHDSGVIDGCRRTAPCPTCPTCPACPACPPSAGAQQGVRQPTDHRLVSDDQNGVLGPCATVVPELCRELADLGCRAIHRSAQAFDLPDPQLVHLLKMLPGSVGFRAPVESPAERLSEATRGFFRLWAVRAANLAESDLPTAWGGGAAQLLAQAAAH